MRFIKRLLRNWVFREENIKETVSPIGVDRYGNGLAIQADYMLYVTKAANGAVLSTQKLTKYDPSMMGQTQPAPRVHVIRDSEDLFEYIKKEIVLLELLK